MFPGLGHSEGRPHSFLRDRERAATCWVLILIDISHLTFPFRSPMDDVLMAAFGAIPHGWVQFEEKKSMMGTQMGNVD